LVISLWGSDVIPFDRKKSEKERLIKRYLLGQSKHLVALSHYLAAELSDFVNKQQEVHIIPWGIEVERFCPSQKDADVQSVCLGFAKRVETISGADVLFKAFHVLLNRTDREVCLRIAGDGALRPALARFAADHGFAEQVEWLGWLNDQEQILDFYRAIDIFVMPSRRESLGVAALEASASGLPVVASQFGGIPEVVDHGQTGLLVKPEDVEGLAEAMRFLVEDRDQRRQMGLRGHRRIKRKFDCKTSVSMMIELYQRIRRT
jgi:glycosyltransferase involved in cell wall biosynthesis